MYIWGILHGAVKLTGEQSHRRSLGTSYYLKNFAPNKNYSQNGSKKLCFSVLGQHYVVRRDLSKKRRSIGQLLLKEKEKSCT